MIALKKILVPTDFSECSAAAVSYGRALATAFGAELHLLHVVQDPYTQPWAAEAFPAPLGDLLQEWEQQAEARLKTLIPETERGTTISATAIGSPFYEIVRYAAEHRVDLIVIGTHGRGALGFVQLSGCVRQVRPRTWPLWSGESRHPAGHPVGPGSARWR